MTLSLDGLWIPASSADPALAAMYERHYSCQRPGRRRNPRFAGPGECMALRTGRYDAMFVWLRARYRGDGQPGVYCPVFRNEGPVRSSDLIRAAMELAWFRWPGERLFTYVDPGLVRSTNPGYCFLMAGWRKCGRSGRGLVLLEAGRK